jgi:heme-degrading monooxygenase HmoA
MNRFKVAPGAEAEFERVWTSRDTHLRAVPGFVEFHLLRGPARDDHVLYASHTIWRSRADVEAWTRSEAFRMAHQRASERVGASRSTSGTPSSTASRRSKR